MEKEVIIWMENLKKGHLIKECDPEGKASWPSSAKVPDRRCFICFKMEHLAWNCPEKKKSSDAAPQVNRIACNRPGCADCQEDCMEDSDGDQE